MAIAGAERIFELLDEEVEEDEGNITLVRAKKDGDTLTECAERDRSLGHGKCRRQMEAFSW